MYGTMYASLGMFEAFRPSEQFGRRGGREYGNILTRLVVKISISGVEWGTFASLFFSLQPSRHFHFTSLVQQTHYRLPSPSRTFIKPLHLVRVDIYAITRCGPWTEKKDIRRIEVLSPRLVEFIAVSRVADPS